MPAPRHDRGRRFLLAASALLLLTWPFIVWLGIERGGLRWMLPLMAVLLLLRLRLGGAGRGPLRHGAMGAALAAVFLCVASLALREYRLLLFYPVLVNAVLLVLFGGSLVTGAPLVERIARWQDPALPAEAIPYTRRVTEIWCVFFLLNGGIALATCLHGDMAVWTAWNGLISYLLIGGLMAGEWIVRQRVMAREQR